MEDYFLVLGDLGNDRYVVRMFIGDQTFDQEISTTLDQLKSTVELRMNEFRNKPDHNLLVDAERPRIDNGHAVILP